MLIRRLLRLHSTLLDSTQYYHNRCEAVKALAAPYPHAYKVTHSLPQFHAQFAALQRGEKAGEETRVAGRVMAIRAHGKLSFYTIQSGDGELQVMLDKAQYRAANFEALSTSLRRGDIVGIQGLPTRTSPRNPKLPGELSIIPAEMTLLSPCLHMLPAHSGLKDAETRYRKRYLDLIFNSSTRALFQTRSQIVNFIRSFLSSKGFLEVETPMMNLIPGGAAAKPFATHLNELNLDLYLRIAPELYLKSLIIGGFERVFEVGKQFRNEGIDITHNPEFTTCEAYWAYADYEDMMRMTEELLGTLVKTLNNGSCKLKYHQNGREKEPVEINFEPPFARVEFMPALESALNVSFPKDLNSAEAFAFVSSLCRQHNIAASVPTTAKMLDKLLDHFVQSKLVHPSFILHHPQLMSPLAKPHRSQPGLSERFELIISGTELCNAYTELNDPFLQKQLFAGQVVDRERGDDEALVPDQAFVEALEHGLPPTAGWGLGVDRLVMLLTDQQTIKEVLLFPLMKPN
jgi:lysyl-tRNA synthetase class 2